MVQPPWDKVVKQFWVYHLSVVGIDGPEHRHNKLEGKGNLLFQVHLLQHITGWLFVLKTQEFWNLCCQKQINESLEKWFPLHSVVFTTGLSSPLSDLQLCSFRQRNLPERERETKCCWEEHHLRANCASLIPLHMGLYIHLGIFVKKFHSPLERACIPNNADYAHLPWSCHAVLCLLLTNTSTEPIANQVPSGHI